MHDAIKQNMMHQNGPLLNSAAKLPVKVPAPLERYRAGNFFNP